MEEKLFTDFPPVSTDKWKQKIMKDLKGTDYDKLIWRTDEGFVVQPFYRREDLEQIPHRDVLPGNFPFVRGNKAKGNRWLVRQDIIVGDVEKTNARLLDIQLKGADSFGIIYEDGQVPDINEMDQLLKNIRADIIELNFSCDDPKAILQTTNLLISKYNRDPDKIKGSLEFCPLSRFSTTGNFYISEEADFQTMSKLFDAGSLLSGFQLITVDGTIFRNAGTGIVSELAFSLAMASDYLTFLTENGHDIDVVAPRIRFHFAVGSDYFMEIAKIRAARFLWAKIVNAYGVSHADNTRTFIHASNTSWNKTLYDPYVNMLRATTESMSAILGGVDSLSVLPFDKLYKTAAGFSERIARNQQLILKNESFFDKVADPASGSYYIEELTTKLIKSAWDLFLQVDEKGGYLKAFKQGFIQQKVSDETEKKKHAIALQKISLLGTNRYPNITEHIDPATVNPPVKPVGENKLELLIPSRGAEAFEEVRLKTDIYAAKNKRPVAWMFTYGDLAMRRARSQFAGNFFGVAGFEISDNPGFSSVEEGIKAARKARPDIVVICSSDEEYADIALPVFEALKDQTIVVLAGDPKGLVEELRAKGLKFFIHARSNVLEELKNYQQILGII